MPKRVLSVVDVQEEYSLGRDLSLAVCNLLPHFYVGRRGLRVFRSDLEQVLLMAGCEHLDLWNVVKEEPELVTRWLELAAEVANSPAPHTDVWCGGES